MTSSFMNTLDGNIIERTIFLRDMTLGMDVLGVKTTDVMRQGFYNSKLSADCITSFSSFTKQDAVIGCCHTPAFIVEQYGGKMKYPEYGIPSPLSHPFSVSMDFDNYNPEPKGMALDGIESYKIVKKKCTNVVANVTGPITKAGVMAGLENIMISLFSDSESLKPLLSFCMENTECVVDAMDRDGSINAGLLASATDNPDLMGMESFKNICIPWTKKFIQIFMKKNLKTIWHPHGDLFTNEIDCGDLVKQTGCDCFHFAEGCNIDVMIKSLNKMPVMGGINITPYLYSGDFNSIEEQTLKYLRFLEQTPYVFSCSCSLHRGIPLKNIKKMVDVIHQYDKGLL